ncbi:MAG: T9SS type A sorting domain-containing protein [Candidatus Neomarinimicrobiota bacterium]
MVIYTSSGTFAAVELFQNLSGTIDIDTVMIFGYSSNTATATSIYGYNGNFAAGLIDDIPTYTMAVDLEVGFWNYFDVSDAGWSFDGDFAIGFEVGTTTGIIYAALDESAAPSVGSYTNLGGWDTWANVAASNGLPDGEWGIRAKAQTTGSDSLAVFYKMYRRIYGEQDWTQCWWMGGDEISGTTWQDYFVQDFTTYDYTVSAVINGNESEFSNTATATVEPITVHELAYDDDGMNTSINTGEGNLLAVRFTPLQYPSKIHRIKIYCAGSDAGVAIAQIWDDDGSDNLPGSVLSPQVGFSLVPGWNVKDVSQLDIIINSGDIYIGIIETSQTPPIGIDTDAPIDGRSYVNVSGTPPSGTNSLWVPLSNLFVGDFMIRTELDSASNVSIEDPSDVSIPQEFKLGQNYPNPFNPVTTLEFDIPENAATQLALFDLSGREVMTIIDRELSAGHYRFQLDGRDLVSGIYIYQIQVNGQQESYIAARKLILLK